MREAKAVSCPFCGAPYRKLIPSNTVQLECQYCGGVFLVPPRIGGIPRCPDHPDRFAIGICNDCGESFCGECLHRYVLETRDARATLYLCPDCLRQRYVKGANAFIYVGLAWLLIGILFSIGLTPMGILLSVGGVGAIIYGFSKKSETPEELTIDDLRAQEEKRKAEISDMGGVDVEKLYNELLTRYISHWGAAGGTELLDGELAAYMRHGVSFAEAVKKVYQRQQNKPV